MNIGRRAFIARLAAALSLAGAARLRAQSPADKATVIQASRVLQIPTAQRQGQTPVITAVSLSSDGQRIATAGDDHVIRVWDAKTGDLLKEFREHIDWVRDVVFDPTDGWLISGGDDRGLKLWHFPTGEVRDLPGSIMPTYQLKWAPNGKQIAEAGFEDKIRIYDVASAQIIREIEAPSGDIRALVFSHDGRLLAAGGRNGKIRIWKTDDFAPQRDIDAHRQRIRSLAFSPDDTQLASGGDDRQLIVWDPRGGGEKYRLPSRTGKIHVLCYCGNQMLAAGSSDNQIRVWDVAQGAETFRLTGHTGSVVALDYHAPTGLLVSGSFDTTVRLWYPLTGAKVNIARQPGDTSAEPSLPNTR
ncbi:MAG: WD40 repeat domain-containing protein [Planctomycetes bacterium]|nr:WD40 repeat domain-containing protein [Planctomycetota bacterium]